MYFDTFINLKIWNTQKDRKKAEQYNNIHHFLTKALISVVIAEYIISTAAKINCRQINQDHNV